MEKAKQIEEMARILFVADCSMCVSEACPAFGHGILKDENFTCNDYLLAKALYDAGYGNVKEALKEFAEKLKKRVEEAETDIIPEGCDSYFKNGAICCEVIIFLKMDELIKEVCGD